MLLTDGDDTFTFVSGIHSPSLRAELQREVLNLQETLEWIGEGFSGPVTMSLLEANIGSLGNHFMVVLKIIERANCTLSEMESGLRNVLYNGAGNLTKALRAAWLSFKESDNRYYRTEIQILTRNMYFELTMVLV